MADSKKISQLTEIDTLDTGDEFAVVDATDSTTKKALLAKFDARYSTPSALTTALNALKWKNSVRAATTVSGTLSTDFANGQVVDGVTLATGNRILIKDQSTLSENGIYVVKASGAPDRATDFASWSQIVKSACLVEEGTLNTGVAFVCNVISGGTIGTNDIIFNIFGSNYVASEYFTVNNTSNQTITGASQAITQLLLNFKTTIANQKTIFGIDIQTQLSGGSGSDTIYYYYSIDGGPIVELCSDEMTPSNFTFTHCEIPITVATPGVHQIQLYISKGGNNVFVFGTGSPGRSYIFVQTLGQIFPATFPPIPAIIYGPGSEETQNFTTGAYEDVNHSLIKFYAKAGEVYNLSFNAKATGIGGTFPQTFYMAYKLNGSSDIEVNGATANGINHSVNIGFNVPVNIVTDGLQQIIIRCAVASGSTQTGQFKYKNTYPLTVSVTRDVLLVNGLSEITVSNEVFTTVNVSATYNGGSPFFGMAAVTGLSVTAIVGSDGVAKFNFIGAPRCNGSDVLFGYQIDSNDPVPLGSVFNGAGITYPPIYFSKTIQGITPGSRVFKFCGCYSTGAAPQFIATDIPVTVEVTTSNK